MAKLEIYESYNKKQIKKLHLIDKHLPYPDKALRWVLLGPTGSGKSTLLKNILFNRAWGYRDFYDEIYLFIKSKDDIEEMHELITRNMMKRKVVIVESFNESDVMTLFAEIEEEAAEAENGLKNILFVFDDMILESGISHATKKNTVTNEVFMRGRHANVSIILSSQRLMWINQNMRRDNLNALTIFYGTNRSDLDTISQEQAKSHEKEEIIAILRQFLKKKYDYITIDWTSEHNFKDKDFRPIVAKEKANTI